jgi:hypothetical protein
MRKVAQRKEYRFQRQGKDDTAPRTPRGTNIPEEKLEGPKGKIGIKNPDPRWQLRLKIERTSEEFDRKAFGLEFVKRATGKSSGLWKMRNWALCRGWPSPKRNKTLLAALA